MTNPKFQTDDLVYYDRDDRWCIGKVKTLERLQGKWLYEILRIDGYCPCVNCKTGAIFDYSIPQENIQLIIRPKEAKDD